MSFTDRLIVWLHVAFVIFTIGPVAVGIMSSPRYIRTRNVAVLRYLLRMTRIFAAASLGVLAFGIVAAQELKQLSKAWVTTSMTLFVVSLVLLVLIMRDQRRAIVALETAAGHQALPAASAAPPSGGAAVAPPEDAPDAAPIPLPPAAERPEHVATVERGRIASLAGITTLMWLVVLVLMIWQP
jgi:hypothetical protein